MNRVLKIFHRLIPLIGLAMVFFAAGFLAVTAFAATNIDSVYPNYFAWSDVVGWLDFYGTDSVYVSESEVDGYARFNPIGEAYSYLSFNCDTGPTGSDCSVPYGVTNDASGNLSGWAWSDVLGWVSFDCHNPETGGTSPDYSCAQSLYQVSIDDQGDFNGWAWNDVAGWISFNCNQTETGNLCGTADYRVSTIWSSGAVNGILESGTFDTERPNGASFNYIVWKGESNGGRVTFQFATSNCGNGATNDPTCDTDIGWGGSKTSGDGAYLGPNGTTNETDVYVTSGPSLPVEVKNQEIHRDKRYFRYKVYIETDPSRSATPIVEDIIVNWSP